MASLAARADLVGQVEDAVAKGATVHLGGEVPDGPGAFYPATVLTGVTPRDARLPRGAVRTGSRCSTRSIRSTRRSRWPTTPRTGWAARCSPVTSTRPTTSPTGSTSAWSGSTPPSRAHPTCRSAESRTPASDANSAASASTSSPTRSSSGSCHLRQLSQGEHHARSDVLRKPQARDRRRPRAQPPARGRSRSASAATASAAPICTSTTTDRSSSHPISRTR